jgi:hypothetical protein
MLWQLTNGIAGCHWAACKPDLAVAAKQCVVSASLCDGPATFVSVDSSECFGSWEGRTLAGRIGAGREVELERGGVRLAKWRRARRRPPPIPVELWELWVELGRRQGTNRNSRVPPVGYYPLQGRGAACGQIFGTSVDECSSLSFCVVEAFTWGTMYRHERSGFGVCPTRRIKKQGALIS